MSDFLVCIVGVYDLLLGGVAVVAGEYVSSEAGVGVPIEIGVISDCHSSGVFFPPACFWKCSHFL